MPISIKQIIDEWDPIGLSAISPTDEYNYEVEQIENYIRNNDNVTSERLAQEINSVFIHAFGEGIYQSDTSQCRIIAQKIIKALYL